MGLLQLIYKCHLRPIKYINKFFPVYLPAINWNVVNMKRSVFELLMDIKVEVLKSFNKSAALPESNCDVLDAMTVDSSCIEIQEKKPEESIPQKVKSKGKVVVLVPETRYFEILDEGKVRKIAYTISGNINADKILLCLPGLLETKSSFLVLHSYFLRFEECRVISIDFSGRGESDNIHEQSEYKMSLYLADISALISQIILSPANPESRLTILGTSMGGVLAMYLTQIFDKKIAGIILNDIALTVNWTSLYALYKSMKNEIGYKEVRDLAQDLSVDEKAITDVQRPGHFDLSYRADIWGMNFHEALEGYKGKVGLIYGGKSEICTNQRVDEAKTHLPSLSTCEVAQAGHPAPFDLKVCSFIQHQMGMGD